MRIADSVCLATATNLDQIFVFKGIRFAMIDVITMIDVVMKTAIMNTTKKSSTLSGVITAALFLPRLVIVICIAGACDAVVEEAC